MLGLINPLAPVVIGNGLFITVNPGNVLLAGVPTNILSTLVSLTANTQNFVFVNSSGVVSVNTSGFPASSLPIAQVTCDNIKVSSWIDSRPDFTLPASSGGNITVFSPWGGLVSGVSLASLSAPNKIQLSGFVIPNTIVASNIVVNVSGTDASNNYDWGIYNASGNLVAHVGPRTVPSASLLDVSVVGSPVTISPGKYYFAFTGVGSGATLCRASGTAATTILTFLALTESATSSTSGTLPSAITIPADSWAVSLAVHGFACH